MKERIILLDAQQDLLSNKMEFNFDVFSPLTNDKTLRKGTTSQVPWDLFHNTSVFGLSLNHKHSLVS